MSSRYKVYDDQLPHFVTTTVVGWIDTFSREIYKEIIIGSISFCQKEKGLNLHAWVIRVLVIHFVSVFLSYLGKSVTSFAFCEMSLIITSNSFADITM